MVPNKKRSRFLLGVELPNLLGVFAVSCRHGISLKLPVRNETTDFVQEILWQTRRENPAKKKKQNLRP